MIKCTGRYGSAEIHAKTIENEALKQIEILLNQKAFEGSNVKIMPDVHAGAGCVIGFTGKFTNNRVIPNIVGVDIGCGMLTYNLGNTYIDYDRFDNYVKSNIPMGVRRNNNVAVKTQTLEHLSSFVSPDDIKFVCNRIGADFTDVLNSVGTLGGGNHFIEIDRDDKSDDLYLIIHSGSRNFGKRIADWHQKKAIAILKEKKLDLKKEFESKIEAVNSQFREEIKQEYHKILATFDVPDNLAFLEGKEAEDYLFDMRVAQKYASANRRLMLENILKFFRSDIKFNAEISFETVHNYISDKDGIIRKGAISANKDEIVLIPLNMRDGCIIAKGKGNQNWNCSAPHGAGRLMSRTEAKSRLSLDIFQNEMKGIHSSTVNLSTLDESPMAYKPMYEILDVLSETAEIISIIKPVYNVKSEEDEAVWRKGKKKNR
ncbi:MAG: RtcB family protein [Candidatus Delongbacteria bacterium]|nr:RtcB family protein [Candidatus Delongbacteria bacterium]MBN2835449.1 RtcB family protein [Candidatus Delongbacteria bacterium]